MAEAAQSDGVTLVILSATRNFESQKRIWENKWKGRVVVEGKNLMTIVDTESRARLILRYSSMPGSSRHHWGTDMDLNSLDNSYFETGPGRKVYQWLQAHAATYGFCQPYTSKESGRTGYEEEKWHWSYLPLAKGFLQDYVRHIHYSDITGFDGSSTASGIGIIERYISGVACQ
jgi:LAS superfamily LD-carboxypeptidase LdcB